MPVILTAISVPAPPLLKKGSTGFRSIARHPVTICESFASSRAPMEIELVPIQTVYAGKVHASPGNLELKLGKGNHAIGKSECAFQVRMHVIGNVVLSQLWLALASHTERVDLVLNFVVCEMRTRYFKVARQLQAIRNVRFAWGQIQLCP